MKINLGMKKKKKKNYNKIKLKFHKIMNKMINNLIVILKIIILINQKLKMNHNILKIFKYLHYL